MIHIIINRKGEKQEVTKNQRRFQYPHVRNNPALSLNKAGLLSGKGEVRSSPEIGLTSKFLCLSVYH